MKRSKNNASGPTVSVILPAYNAARTILEAISSVLSGTFSDLEIIVCDDCSSDETVAAVRSIRDERLRLICNKRNLGPGASREEAIAISRGRWIAFIDADDRWRPERLDALLRAAGEDQHTIVFDDILLCHDTAHGLEPWRRLHGAGAFLSHNKMYVDLPAARWAAAPQFVMQPLIPTAALRSSGVHHSGRLFQEDTEFVLRLVASGCKLRYVPRAYYLYRITPGSLSATRRPGAQTREVLEEVLPLFKNDSQMTRALRDKILYRRFTDSLRKMELSKASYYFFCAPKVLPELVRRLLRIAAYELHRLIKGGASR